VLRFALHGPGKNSHVSRCWQGMACRGSTLVGPYSARAWLSPYRPEHPAFTDRRKGLLPALNDRVSTRGETR